MKKYILNIILFFSILTIVDIVAGGTGDYLQTHAKGGSTKRTDDLVSKDNHDILVLGSSRAHHHYDTPFISDSLGVDIYNAGYDGNGVILAYGLLEMMLERYNPKLVMYDVTPNFDIYEYQPDNDNTRYLTILKPYYKNQGVEPLMRDISFDVWLKSHSGLVRYNSRLVTLMTDFAGIQGVEDAGYAPAMGKLSEDRIEEANMCPTIDSVKMTYIERMVDLAEVRGIPFVFVASPWYGASDSNVFQPIKDLCERRNKTFLDYFTDSVFQSKELFNDPGHLNNEGARIFSRKLICETDLFKNDSNYN